MTTKTDDQERADFEANQNRIGASTQRVGDKYREKSTQSAWIGWQARAAVQANGLSADDLADIDDALANLIQDKRDYCPHEDGTAEQVARLEALRQRLTHGGNCAAVEADRQDQFRDAPVAQEPVDWRSEIDTIANNIGEALSGATEQGIVDAINPYVDQLFALIRQDAATVAQELTSLERKAIAALLNLARTAYYAAEDSEDNGDEHIHVDRASMTALSNALDALDELPDDQPGCVMGPSSKARWALRRLITDATPVAAQADVGIPISRTAAPLAAQASAQDREDAQRYRWLRQQQAPSGSFRTGEALVHAVMEGWAADLSPSGTAPGGNVWSQKWISGGELDAAIDAARAAKGADHA